MSFSFKQALNLALTINLILLISGCKEKQKIKFNPFENKSTFQKLDYESIETDSLSNHINSLMKNANVHGLAISIFSKNQLVFQKHFGTANIQTGKDLEAGHLFYAASFSKIIFAFLVMQLVEENVIDLDKPLFEYVDQPLTEAGGFEGYFNHNIPGYEELANDNRINLITARMCLSHTTGLPNWRWIEDDKKLKIKFDPGTRYSYSGEGMLLLQRVIESITGRDLQSMAREKIFDRLGMTYSSFIWEDRFEGQHCYGHTSENNVLEIREWKEANGAGSLTSSLEDMTRFFDALLRREVLSDESYEEMLDTQVRIHSLQQFGPDSWKDTTSNDDISLSYGLGFGLYYTPHGSAFFKEGHDDGWQHYSVAFPEKGMAMIIMSNSDNAESIFKELQEVCLANYYMPWYWENYIPFQP